MADNKQAKPSEEYQPGTVDEGSHGWAPEGWEGPPQGQSQRPTGGFTEPNLTGADPKDTGTDD